MPQPSNASIWLWEKHREPNIQKLSKINFSIPNAGTFATLGFPVGGATGVLYARRSADGIFTGGRTASGLAQFANVFADRLTPSAARLTARSLTIRCETRMVLR